MSQDSAMRARVAGRVETEARTAWSLDLGGLRFRCLRETDGSYLVQARSTKGWTEEVARGADAVVLLRAVVNSKMVAKALETGATS